MAGAASEFALFEAFGNAVVTADFGGATTSGRPFGFVGGEQYQADAESGLMLLGNRYYDPGIGRFLSSDPAEDGDNFYAYVENNPVNAIDPEGLQKRKRHNRKGGQTTPPWKKTYPTADTAATAALDYAYKTSTNEDREYGGNVDKVKKGYRPSKPQHGDEDTFDPHPVRKTVAIYHTHPDTHGPGQPPDKQGRHFDNDNFSDDDRNWGRGHKMPVYLGAPHKRIKRFNPKTNKDELVR